MSTPFRSGFSSSSSTCIASTRPSQRTTRRNHAVSAAPVHHLHIEGLLQAELVLHECTGSAASCYEVCKDPFIRVVFRPGCRCLL